MNVDEFLNKLSQFIDKLNSIERNILLDSFVYIIRGSKTEYITLSELIKLIGRQNSTHIFTFKVESQSIVLNYNLTHDGVLRANLCNHEPHLGLTYNDEWYPIIVSVFLSRN